MTEGGWPRRECDIPRIGSTLSNVGVPLGPSRHIPS